MMKTQHLADVSTYFQKKRYATWTNFGYDRRSAQNDHFLVLGKDTRRALGCGYTGDLAYSDHRAVKCTLRVQYKLVKPKVKSERSKLVMKDFSALVRG
jgi:hypothetical protein